MPYRVCGLTMSTLTLMEIPRLLFIYPFWFGSLPFCKVVTNQMGAQHVFCCTIWSVHGWICHGELLGDIYPATAYSSYNNCAVRAQCEELLYSSATCYKELYPMASKQMLQAKLNQNVKPMYSLSDNPVNCHPPEQEIISRPAWPNSRTLRSVTGIC